MQAHYLGQTIHVVVAMLHDKDVAATLAALDPIADHWYPASLSGPRAASASELCQSLESDVKQYQTPVDAFDAALATAKDEELILVVGSFHTVGEVLDYWQKKGI